MSAPLDAPWTTRDRLVRRARAGERCEAEPRAAREPRQATHGPRRAREAAVPRATTRPRRGGEHPPAHGERLTERRPRQHEPEHAPLALPERGREHPRARRARGPPARRAGPFIVQTKLEVTVPGDALEREADEVAARVLNGQARPRRAPLTRAHARAPPPVPAIVEQVVASPAGGQALDASIRSRIEPHVGIELGHVRVRHDAAAAQAAHALKAHAFTSGHTIFLGAHASRSDLGLMAHEVAHVAQQNPASQLARFAFTDLLPDWAIDDIRSLPGYRLLTYITGTDPLTDEQVTPSREELVETLLTFGPFGAAVGTVLQAIDVLTPVFTFISDGLQRHDLTLARITRDIGAAWNEMGVRLGIDGNVAIVRRYINRFLDDVRAFVGEIVDRVIAMVREVVADVAEPLLQTPEIAPVWNLAKKVIHYDPLHGRPVEATTAEIIADFLHLIGQDQRLQQMRERGTLETTAAWLDTQLGTFTSLIGELGTLFSDAWAAIQPENLPNLLDNLGALARRAFGFVERVGAFAATVIAEILRIIKEALLAWLSEHAHTIPGFHLLTVILGRNPFTGEAVARTPRNLIRGFVTLLPNGEQTYEQLEQSGVIGDAAARIEQAMTRLGISWDMVTRLFHAIWDGLSLDDLLDPIGAFIRVLDQFGEPLRRLAEFVGVVIGVVIELVLALLNFPSDLLAHIIANARQAVADIKRDPIGFLKNMLAAVKLGLTNFFGNILTYLLSGLQAWLFRGLGRLGITIPAEITFQSILQLVLQVLNLNAETLWTKLARHIGAERVALIRRTLDRLSGAWQFIKDVQEGGIGAVWRYVRDQLSNLWDTLLGMARDWIMRTIVDRVTARLLTLLDPTGVMAVINGFIAFFNAVQSAIEYLRDILEIVDRYVSTLAAVAAGNIVPGAQMLERGLAAAIPVAIGFLANQVGLGNIPEQIVALIERLRALVDQALDWLIAQAIRLGQAALNALGVGGGDASPEGRKRAAIAEIDAAMERGLHRSALIALVADVRTRLQLRRCELVGESNVVIENSAPVTLEGVLAISADELTNPLPEHEGLPGGVGGPDLHLGEYHPTVTPGVPTLRGVLEEHMDGPVWPPSIAALPTTSNRPEESTAKIIGRVDLATRQVRRIRGASGIVGMLGNVERAARRGIANITSHYEGGHIIGHQFAGPDTDDNLTPMLESLNRGGLYNPVEAFVEGSLPRIPLGTDTSGMETALELAVKLDYGRDARFTLRQLVALAANEFTSQPPKDALIAKVRPPSWQERPLLPARVPTRIALDVTLTRGRPGRAAAVPGAANIPTGQMQATREIDPFIRRRSATARPAPAPARGRRADERDARADVDQQWRRRWVFTQQNA